MSGEQAIIDVWMQHPTRAFLNHEMFASLRRWLGLPHVEEDLPAAFTLGSMDEAGVRTGLISAWHGPQGALIPNDWVAALCAEHPERFRGLCAVDLTRPMDAVATLKRCIQEEGFIGLRIVQWLWGLPPTDRYYYPLFAACCELDAPVCLQVGHTGPMRPSETGRPIPYIDEIALDFPELKVVCGHIGYPWTQEMIAVATKHPNVYIDTSAYKAKRFPPELVNYMTTHGKEKVMYGTNFPMLTHAACLDGFAGLGLSDEAARLYFSGNAARVFGLEPAAG